MSLLRPFWLEAEAETVERNCFCFCFLLLLPTSASMYLEALSRDMLLILLRLLEKDIFELDLEGCFENHNCQIWSKKLAH